MTRPDEPIPWHAWPLLLAPRRVRERLGRAPEVGLGPTPNLWQVELGVLRMWERVLFRSETVGTCVVDPPRRTLRARILEGRFFRLWALLAEGAISPWDQSGFYSSRERILRHLLGAHHDQGQAVYDLQLLSLHPGGLEALRERVVAVLDGRHPRAEWLRDLVVYERYHERLLVAVDAFVAGAVELDDVGAQSPDISLRAYLRWCARQPRTPAETWRAWREGRFTLREGLREPADAGVP